VAGGTGGAAALAIAGLGLLAVEGWIARRRRHLSSDLAPAVSGTFGSGPEVRLVLFGDSTAAGLGVQRPEQTLGGRLAELLAATEKRVRLASVAVSGAHAVDLDAQVARALVHGAPDVAVVVVGAEDAIRFTPLDEIGGDVAAVVGRLVAVGTAVVVATCPDLGAARNFPRPLRQIVAWNSRRVAAVTARATFEAGGVPVDLAARTGPVFRADPGTISGDGYHPSADGYQLWALALYPAVYEASRTASTAG